jgi:DMSO reductase family type II enzyme chaperone
MLTDEDHRALEQAEVRSGVYGFLAAVMRYPDRETLALLNEPGRWSGWSETLARTDPGLCELLGDLRANLPAGSPSDQNDAQLAALQESHVVLFGHAVRGTCPPYELEYEAGDIPQKSNELADIAGFYSAFGMEMDANAHERADHVAVQCEFMGVLALKAVYALETDNADAQQIVSDAQRTFLADHAGRWMPAVALRLTKADPKGFYGRLGRFLGEFIASECDRFEVRRGPQLLELRPADPERDAKIECGVETSCPGASAPAEGQPLVQIGIDRD